MDGDPILSIEDLHVWFKVYGGVMKVLEGASLTVGLGERVGLVGESGCGKTTTMKAVLRILSKQAVVPAGRILFQGRDVLKMRGRELQALRGQKLSMIFQDPTASLNPVFTIGEQIRDAIKYSGFVSRNGPKARDIAVQALRDCAMPDPERIMNNYPFQLSGGMRQRVCIATALATAGSLLVADEPTTNLDVTIQDQVLELMHSLVQEKGTSFILITHSLGVAREMTDRIYVMYAGRMVEVAPTEVIFEHPCHPYTQGLLHSIPKLTGEGMMEGIPGRLPSYLNPPSGCRFYPRCAQVLPECQAQKPPLFEIAKGHQVACFRYQNQSAGSPGEGCECIG
ncbi:ABC transporter ATP-binding protein [Candidatus Formimonas warabiya]|uniref:Peptide ABC transporter ATP-binding protein n=1 Tax=Formimonas warabiya TaxID=1761012 RepID=A0A3G1KY01_FORW1|nr:ABC transporter ATP-binding protein [Candidatus Formimonas warabiya]ATW27290.1 peptide ABC transporter ATP-binding protein [Candidatus Formimonas warabiya]